jgi:hypothetical protein
MASSPVFAVTPRINSATISTANTSRDGTGAVSTVMTGASTGTRVAEIVVKANGTTTAGMCRIFLNDGTNFYLFDEIAVPAVTPSASVQTARVLTTYANLILPSSSWSIRASTHNAESMTVTALGADL